MQFKLFQPSAEPPVSEVYRRLGLTTKEEQDKFSIYTHSRLNDFGSWQKCQSKEFRDFLAKQREKSFPSINRLYYEKKATFIARQVLEKGADADNIALLVDIEMFDDICEKIAQL